MSYSPKSQARYKAAHTRHYGITLNDRTDADLIAALDAALAKQTLIKTALRAYLRKETPLMDGAKEIIDSGNYDTAVALMDDEIREAVHADLAPCTELEFLTEYMARHEAKYGEPFTI